MSGPLLNSLMELATRILAYVVELLPTEGVQELVGVEFLGGRGGSRGRFLTFFLLAGDMVGSVQNCYGETADQ
jgi:hypothetical protein